MKDLLKAVLQVLVFPVFILYSVLEALIANPFHFNYSKGRGVEIGIVPLAVIIALVELTKYLITQ
jgi:hypothetical protein